MVSFIQVNGRLTCNPTIKIVKTAKGEKEVTEISLASNNYIGNKNNVVYYNITLWPGRSDKMKPLLKKGSCVLVSGQFYQNFYKTKDLVDKVSNNINCHTICFPVCEHPTSMSTDATSEVFDDNDLITEIVDETTNEVTSENKLKKRKTGK